MWPGRRPRLWPRHLKAGGAVKVRLFLEGHQAPRWGIGESSVGLFAAPMGYPLLGHGGSSTTGQPGEALLLPPLFPSRGARAQTGPVAFPNPLAGFQGARIPVWGPPPPRACSVPERWGQGERATPRCPAGLISAQDEPGAQRAAASTAAGLPSRLLALSLAGRRGGRPSVRPSPRLPSGAAGPAPPDKRPLCARPVIGNHQSPVIIADEAGGGGAFPGAPLGRSSGNPRCSLARPLGGRLWGELMRNLRKMDEPRGRATPPSPSPAISSPPLPPLPPAGSASQAPGAAEGRRAEAGGVAWRGVARSAPRLRQRLPRRQPRTGRTGRTSVPERRRTRVEPGAQRVLAGQPGRHR